ncbi:MAG: UPF0182 family protein [Alphaproteobacteria bacterium]|nr:UPF0182 family protein [Alphaproteobacteria bacterium]
MSRRFPTLTLVVVALLVLVSARTVAAWVVDALWVVALGQPVVVVRHLAAQVATALCGAVLVGGAVAASGAWAMQHTRNRPIVLAPDWRGTSVDRWFRRPDALERTLRNGTWLAALFAAVMSVAWADALLTWWHHVPFERVDPVLGLDLAVFVYTLPLLQAGRTLLLVATVLALAVATAIYLLRGAVTVVLPEATDTEGRASVRMDAGPRRHLAVLTATVIVWVAAANLLQRLTVLQAPGTVFDGPGFVEVHVVLPLLVAQALAGLLAAWLAFQALDHLRRAPALAAVGLLVANGVLHVVVPMVADAVFASPEAPARQAGLLQAHLDATWQAWGLDDLVRVAAVPTPGAPDQGAPVRAWERAAWLEATAAAVGSQPERALAQVTIDRAGHPPAPVLRTAWQATTPTLADARTWAAQHVIDLRPRALVQGPADHAHADGTPVLDVGDAPPVHFGTVPLPYGVVGPVGPMDTAAEADVGALALGSLPHRMLLALALGDVNLLLAAEATPDARLLVHRTVTERVRALAPFLWVDDDPALVPVDGRLLWLVEAATTTDQLPLSSRRRLPGARSRLPVNGARHAVTATVDATSGAVTLYVRDPSDPLLATWRRAYPGLLVPIAEAPAGVQGALRPMTALASVQAGLLGRFHDADPARVLAAFTAHEEPWQVPTDAEGPLRPVVSLVRAPGEATPAFGVTVPLTREHGAALAGWLLVRADTTPHHVLVTLPEVPPSPGPTAVGPDMLDDRAVQATMVRLGGATALGVVRLVPDGPTPRWVRPLVLRTPTADAPPRLAGVVWAEGGAIGVGTPWRGAGGVARHAVGAPGGVAGDAARRLEAATAAWERASAALREGAWATFGEAFEDLGATLRGSAAAEVDGVSPTGDVAPDDGGAVHDAAARGVRGTGGVEVPAAVVPSPASAAVEGGLPDAGSASEDAVAPQAKPGLPH